MLSRMFACAGCVSAALWLVGCGSAVMRPAGDPPVGVVVHDPGLVGEWATKDPADSTQVRAIIRADAGGDLGMFLGSVVVHHDGQFKAATPVEITLTEIAGTRYLDLFLARSERDRLVTSVGFLVVPVHQFLKVERLGDELTLWMLNADTLERPAAVEGVGIQRVSVGGGHISMLSADSPRLHALLAKHGGDDGAFHRPVVLRRWTR